MRVHEVDVHPALPERLGWLGEIARNVWTSWNPEAQELFARLDPEGWEAVEQNPVALLRRLPQERLDAAAADEGFVAMVARVARRLDAYANDEGWFPGAHPDAAGMRVAYFSLEFGLDAGIPLYSGGLGILAGDHLKSASDLGVPLVGVGLLYRGGYFRQSLGPDGGQRERYPATDWGDLPLADQPGPDGGPSPSRSRSAARPSGRRSAGSRSAACRCCCSTPTSRATRPRRATSRASSTAATASCASARRSCSASGACARSPRRASRPRSST